MQPQINPQIKTGLNLTPQTVQCPVTGTQAWRGEFRDTSGRRRLPQRECLGPGRGGPRPGRPTSRPRPAHRWAPRFPPDAGGPGSLADVTPRAEVTFSRGWTRRSVAGRGRACPVSLRGRSNYFCNGSRERTGRAPKCARPPSPALRHHSLAPALGGSHAAQNPPESSSRSRRRRRRRTPGAAAAPS